MESKETEESTHQFPNVQLDEQHLSNKLEYSDTDEISSSREADINQKIQFIKNALDNLKNREF